MMDSLLSLFLISIIVISLLPALITMTKQNKILKSQEKLLLAGENKMEAIIGVFYGNEDEAMIAFRDDPDYIYHVDEKIEDGLRYIRLKVIEKKRGKEIELEAILKKEGLFAP
ncbi:MAG: hypothetical protein Q4P25_00620 [Tissierellia bacterium]|nr:hypothetical protein [Tissierellia bacterium]